MRWTHSSPEEIYLSLNKTLNFEKKTSIQKKKFQLWKSYILSFCLKGYLCQDNYQKNIRLLKMNMMIFTNKRKTICSMYLHLLPNLLSKLNFYYNWQHYRRKIVGFIKLAILSHLTILSILFYSRIFWNMTIWQKLLFI